MIKLQIITNKDKKIFYIIEVFVMMLVVALYIAYDIPFYVIIFVMGFLWLLKWLLIKNSSTNKETEIHKPSKQSQIILSSIEIASVIITIALVTLFEWSFAWFFAPQLIVGYLEMKKRGYSLADGEEYIEALKKEEMDDRDKWYHWIKWQDNQFDEDKQSKPKELFDFYKKDYDKNAN
ncbi:MAG: hypothetical protein NTY74_16275 [Ignavibacteriae bacterium]|nr:hypothetical protein [Ignavibacteriota bacterium]